ncbi:MAG: hypothetical protein ACI9XO_001620 [Paraglaciecola sp.]|jgi:hypothetical protein
MKNIFKVEDTQGLINRINQLTPETQGKWGKMTVSKMLAHCYVTCEMTFTDKHPKPNFLVKFILKTFVKKGVVGPKPYAKNIRTAPAFIIDDERDFTKEKQRLVDYLKQTQQLGADHFHNKEYNSFGPLTKDEWNILFYKHLDHHLTQFGV